MGFLKKLFNKREKEELEDFKEKDICEEVQYRDGDPVCERCGLTIGREQKIKTFNGKKFHLKPCWYKLRREASVVMYNP